MSNASGQTRVNRFQKSSSATTCSVNPQYLNSCSDVELEAYDRVIHDLQKKSHNDEAIELMQKSQRDFEEQQEKLKRDKLKKELMQTTEYLRKQIEEKAIRDKIQREKEKDVQNAVYNAMPQEVVASFPRIVEIPADIQRRKELEKKTELKKDLIGQMSNREIRKSQERDNSKAIEQARLKQLSDAMKKEEEQLREHMKEKKDRYAEDLKKDIDCKIVKKENQKKLDTMEYKGMTKIISINEDKKDDKKEETIKEEKKEEVYPLPGDAERVVQEEAVEGNKDIEVVENFFKEGEPENNDKDENNKAAQLQLKDEESGNPKLAELIARKQKKTTELLKKIEELEKRGPGKYKSSISIAKLKSALSPTGYRYSSTTGKESHITGKEANKIITEAEENRAETRSVRSVASRAKSHQDMFAHARRSTVNGNNVLEQTQKIAYDRYLSHLENQVQSLIEQFIIG